MWLLKDLSVFTFFFFFLSSLQLALQQASARPRYYDCAPRRCGNVSVQYPFWLSGSQHPFCGDPVTSFQLTCNDNKTGKLSSTFFGFTFYIQQIYYSNQPVHFTVGGAGEICRLFLTSKATDEYPFTLSPSNRRILFLLNCFNTDNRYQSMSCPGFTLPVLFAGEYFPNSSHENCSFLSAPVMSYVNISASRNYTAMLMTGWLVNWTASRLCQRCNESDGRCGHDNSTDSSGFICMCPDGVHTTRCKSEYLRLD